MTFCFSNWNSIKPNSSNSRSLPYAPAYAIRLLIIFTNPSTFCYKKILSAFFICLVQKSTAPRGFALSSRRNHSSGFAYMLFFPTALRDHRVYDPKNQGLIQKYWDVSVSVHSQLRNSFLQFCNTLFPYSYSAFHSRKTSAILGSAI